MEKLPARAGLSFSSEYAKELLLPQPQVAWLEVIPEHFLASAGEAHHLLERLALQYPLTMCAQGFSLGSAESLPIEYLAAIKKLVDRYRPAHVSASLNWNRWQGVYLTEPLPLPYTEESLDQVSINIKNVQSTLGRRILVENPAVYITLDGHEMGEGTFIEELIRSTGCGFLLDINNLYVSSSNAGQDPFKVLASYPLAAVQEIHLSGHSLLPLDDTNMLLVNDHASAVWKPVWQLYRDALELMPKPVATLVDRQNELPPLTALLEEVQKVNGILEELESNKGARA